MQTSPIGLRRHLFFVGVAATSCIPIASSLSSLQTQSQQVSDNRRMNEFVQWIMSKPKKKSVQIYLFNPSLQFGEGGVLRCWRFTLAHLCVHVPKYHVSQVLTHIMFLCRPGKLVCEQQARLPRLHACPILISVTASSRLPQYRWRKDFVADVSAGFTVAVMHIPQGWLQPTQLLNTWTSLLLSHMQEWPMASWPRWTPWWASTPPSSRS